MRKLDDIDYSHFLAASDETEVAHMLDEMAPLDKDRTAMRLARQVAGGRPSVYTDIFKTAYGIEPDEECRDWLENLRDKLAYLDENDTDLAVRIAIDRVERCVAMLHDDGGRQDTTIEDDGLPPIESADDWLDDMP